MENKKINKVIVGSIKTNCWFYPLDEHGHCIVIDPGDKASIIISRLKELLWVPRYIFLTHGHFDHVTALPALLAAFTKGLFDDNPIPKVGIHRQDIQFLEMTTQSTADIFFEEGDVEGPFRVLHIPGHTPGSCGFYDERENVLFSGDTLFKGDRGRTDLPGGSEEQIQQSLKRLLSLPEETVVCPGHGPMTTIMEERRNPYLLG